MITFQNQRRLCFLLGALLFAAVSVLLWHFIPEMDRVVHLGVAVLIWAGIVIVMKPGGQIRVPKFGAFLLGLIFQALVNFILMPLIKVPGMQILPQLGIAIFCTLFAVACEKGIVFLYALPRSRK